MKPYIQISLSTGQLYEIPTEVIAQHRAAYYHGRNRDGEFPTLESALEDTRELFADSREIREWALGDMDPEDYMPHARLARFTPPAPSFDEAVWSFHDQPAISAELDGEQIMAQPVEAVMSAMAASRQLCSITVLNNTEGIPFGAAVMILGDNNAVGAFITAIQFTIDQLTKSAGAAVPATN